MPAIRKRRGWVVLIVISALAIVGRRFAHRAFYTLKGIPDAYAMWDTGLLLIDYMETHDRRWPGGWDDLKESWNRRQPANSSGGEPLRGGMTLDQLRRRVGVDWDVDAARIASMPERDKHLHAVWTLDGNTTLWAGADPNQMVWNYLHAAAPVTTQPVK